ncbi:MAG: rhomboid family intramembrane serine protease [Planctomycetales bacterium]|nr:rhomboid family intramembrane serine protease [Planctomycetales bacterium]
MGIYDRNYYEADERSETRSSIVVKLIVITVVVFIFDSVLTQPGPNPNVQRYPITEIGALKYDWWQHPWQVYQLVTHGFLHAHLDDPNGRGLLHIFMNMMLLFFLGRMLEQELGGRELLVVYFGGMIAGGLFWSVAASLSEDPGYCVGASGAVTSVLIAMTVKQPRQQLALFGVFAVPLFVLSLVLLGLDIIGAMGSGGSGVAYHAHLGGAAFGAAYAYFGWQWSKYLSRTGWKKAFKRQPKLRLVRDDFGDYVEADQAEEDRILAKIQAEGTDSLTASERRFLQKRSELARKKRET